MYAPDFHEPEANGWAKRLEREEERKRESEHEEENIPDENIKFERNRAKKQI